MSQKSKKSRKIKKIRVLIILILVLFTLISLLYYLNNSSLKNIEYSKNNGKVEQYKVKKRTVNANKTKKIEAGTRKEHPQKRGKLVFIIDDAGNSLNDLKPFLDFPGKITISVLPGLPLSKECAIKIVKAGKGLMLHLPMEAISEKKMGPGGISVGETRKEILKTIAEDFKTVPGASGANNHMGSRATADDKTMDVVMEYFHNNGKYFVDSKTTSVSKAKIYAEKWKVPFAERDVFLDNTPDRTEIKEWIEKGIKIATKKGYAVLIGHVKHPQILDVLDELIPNLDAKGIQLAMPEEILERFK